MSDYHFDIHALIDPGQTERLIDGGRLQHITVVISDGPADLDDPAAWPAPAACPLPQPSARAGLRAARPRRGRRATGR
jgi:hypothetical protein